MRMTSAGPPPLSIVASLLLLHAAVALWGASRHSVTFDENFHLPAGVAAIAHGDFTVSPVNPPLVKVLQGGAALAAGARVPADSAWTTRGQYEAGAAFQRANVDRYQRVYVAARAVTVVLSLALALVVMGFARALYGPSAGVLALALYVLTPEALAHAGFATMDTATALGWTATVAAFWRFGVTLRRAWWGAAAVAFAFAMLTRFTALALLPVLAALAALLSTRMERGRRTLWAGLALLVPAGLIALWAGYLGQVSWAPLGSVDWHSARFSALAESMPWLRLPLPDAWLAGLDHQALEGQTGLTPTYLFGQIRTGAVPEYFPIAIALKWPLALLLLAALALAHRGRAARAWRDEAFVWLPPLALLVTSMTLVQINAGVRYMLPLLPFMCVFASRVLGAGTGTASAAGVRAAGRVAQRPTGARGAVVIGVAAVLGVAAEAAAAAPWFLTSFNPVARIAGNPERLLNDSNVDWGQGLLALREELRARGIGRVHLAYHGTTDPAVYGIDYIPYLGGALGPESEWLAVSSYFQAGLAQRMVTPGGRTDFVHFDLSALAPLQPAARPARCMALYRIR